MSDRAPGVDYTVYKVRLPNRAAREERRRDMTIGYGGGTVTWAAW